MCGVIGYIGNVATPEFFYNALKRLEYRGYDSAGIAMLCDNKIYIQKAEGKLSKLAEKLNNLPVTASVGIGHTRWATHGKPTENNAHPHISDNIVLLHNGIIENYSELKEELLSDGYNFLSETDTEVAVHLLNKEYKLLNAEINLELRMQKAILNLVKKLKGAFAFGIICNDTPDVLYAIKLGSPLIVGAGINENYFASGITALVEHTKKMYVLEDYQIAILKKDSIKIIDFNGKLINVDFVNINWSISMIEKGGYKHFMLKEIYEHPEAIMNTINNRIERNSGRINLTACGLANINLKDIKKIQIIACGTSYYASLLGKYFIERFVGISADVDIASEYRYRYPTMDNDTLVIAISQSGETADTLQGIKFAKMHGAKTLAIVNVPSSSIAHVCGEEFLLHAGPEIGVASTKAFTAQISALYLLALALAQEKNKLLPSEQKQYAEELIKVPSLIEKCLSLSKNIEKLSQIYYKYNNILFIGRGPEWAIALEGALKLKELSYIHAEAYAGGELKHGPIALIDENMPVVCLAPKDSYYEKTISNIEEVKARGAKIFSIGTVGDSNLQKISEHFIAIPECCDVIMPFLTIVPLHLFAYWVAVKKGTDVDQPRNLAKSVTVE